MGGLKETDPSLGSTEGSNEPSKKRRPGNPNFQKGKKNYAYDKSKDTNNSTTTTMAEETTNQNTGTGTATNSEGKKEIPKDIFSDEIPKNQTSPLNDEVVKKDYGSINDGTAKGPNPPPNNNGTTTNTTIPETPPNGPGTATVDPNAPPQQPSAAAIAAAEEAQTQAKQAVAMALKGYDKLHSFGRWYGKMDPSKLASLHHAGKINLNETFPLGKDPVSAATFFEQYNKNIDETIIVTEEFKQAIEPPLVRLAIKYNIRLSDEMFVLGLVADDLIPKASMLIGLKQTCNLILDALHTSIKNQNEQKTSSQNTQKEEKKEEVKDPTADNWKEAQTAEAVN